MKNSKWKILILFVVLAVPVFVVLGAWHYVNSLNLKSSMEFVTMEALITETDVGSSGLDGRLYVTCNGIVDGIICFDHSTRIYNKNGKKISGNDLKAVPSACRTTGGIDVDDVICNKILLHVWKQYGKMCLFFFES